jgi:hypothetical protein
MSEFKTYQRVGSIEARCATYDDWQRAEQLRISISPADRESGLRTGGMIARNPANHVDQWYIAPDYFAKHYGEPQPDARNATIARQAGEIERLTAALRKAEAALADIGDSEGAPKSGVLNLKWAEQRAADVLPDIRAALRPVAAGETAITDTARLDWLLTDASRGQALRVQGSEERGWSVMDMADGLVRVGRGANYRQAIDDAMSNHPPQASGEE